MKVSQLLTAFLALLGSRAPRQPTEIFTPIFPGAEAVLVGNRDYKTAVFCGPEIDCDYLQSAAKKNKIRLITDGNVGDGSGFERLVVEAHGTEDGSQQLLPKYKTRSDFFAKRLFPDARIIHIVSCYAGVSPQKNFAENSLKSGQILFLHAGDQMTSPGVNYEISSALILKPNRQFPAPIPLHILLKEGLSTIFTNLAPVPLEDVIAATGANEIYDVIAQHINAQKTSALENFSENLEERNVIGFELERLGFRDFSRETNPSKKDEFVKNYLGQYLISLAAQKEISSADLQNIGTLMRLNLIDTNYAGRDAGTAAIAACNNGHEELLQLLKENGADLSRVRKDGATAIHAAASSGQTNCLEILLRNGVDPDSVNGFYFTASYVAAAQGNHQCLEILARNGADLNKADGKGSTPIVAATFNGHVESIRVLAQNEADFDRPINNGETALMVALNKHQQSLDTQGKSKYKEVIFALIKGGSNPELRTSFGTAYEFARDNKVLLKEMKKGRKEFLEKPRAILEEPQANPLKEQQREL